MASVSSLSFSVPSQYPDRRAIVSSTRTLPTNSQGFRLRTSLSCHCVGIRASVSSRLAIHCMSTSIVGYLVKLVNFSARRDRQEDMWRAVKEDCELVIAELPTVSETKLNFLKSYKRPIPAVYNNVIQELIVQQHLMKYKRTYRYDPVFALGFVTVYDQLMDGYPSDEDRDAIFQAYIKALKEDPEQYRIDAQKLEEWARAQTASSLVEFASREGEVEGILKDIAERAGGKGSFSYSRFFAVGLFRLLELANATEPKILEKLCASLNVNKRSVDRDLDVYRNLLSKLVQAKELLKEYMDREKKKREERAGVPQANEAITKCLGEYQHAGL